MRNTTKNFYQRTWRWWVLGTLFLATFLNYFDRQTLGTAIEPISKEFGLDNIQRGNLLSAFLFTYACTHLFIGAVVDRIKNIRVFFPVMVIGWSLSSLLVAFAHDFHTLLGLRYLLGVWEAVNFPICLMIISRIFPARERSLAAGIFASGAFLATLAAPPVVIYFSNHFDWRDSFIVAGAIGILWLVPWLLIFRNPERRSTLWNHALSNSAGHESNSPNKTLGHILKGYMEIVKSPGFWGVALIGLGIVPSLYFATQWFPTFFTEALHQPYDQSLSARLMVIYLMQDVGLWLGGAVVLWLAKRGTSILKSRKLVMTGAYVLMLTILLVPGHISVNLSVTFLSLYVLGIGAFLGNQHAFKQDVAPSQVATVAALVGFVEMTFTAYVINQIGFVTNQTADFTPVFFFMAGLATFALLVVYVLLRPKWIKIR